MYDEATRQQDHYWASLTYAQEEGMRLGIEQGIERGIGLGIEQGIERGIGLGIERGIGLGIEKGIERGIEKGRAEGIEEAVITLLRNGYISPEVAAAQLKVDIEDLDKYL